MATFPDYPIPSQHGHLKCLTKLKQEGTHPALKDAPLPSRQLFHHIHDRQYGLTRARTAAPLASHYSSRLIPGLLKEKQYNLNDINKIFASQWVSERQVVFGTKCNKLMVLDLVSKQKALIPSLRSSSDSQPADCPCGIHSIATNPSRSLLATGAVNTNDLAVYRLPTLDPVCVGEFGHTDWIFDIKWLDDQFVVTGSRDNTMALWSVRDDDRPDNGVHGNYGHIRPATVTLCRKAEKVRAMAYNSNTQELLALSLNAYVHLWDANKFIQKNSQKLGHTRENVCVDVCEAHNLFAIGSQSHIALIDPRSLRQVNHIVSKQRGSGVRSLNFCDNLITIGTGGGAILFYDLRASRYMEHDCGHALTLKLGKGWLLQDETYRDYFFNADYPNAVYTHCMDPSRSKLFAAGGPLPAGLWGNYGGLWS